MDFKATNSGTFFANGIGLNARDALSNSERTDNQLKVQRNLKYFDFVVTLSQLSGIVMMGLAAFVYGTTDGGLRWNTDKQSALQNNSGNINFHGLLTTALVFFQGEALLLFRLYRHEVKLVAKTLNGLFSIFSVLLTVTAVIVIIGQKNMVNERHFTSHHGWIGLALLVALAVYILIGTVIFWFPKSSPQVLQLVLPIQRAAGMTLFLINVGLVLTGTLQYTSTLGTCYTKMNCPKKLDMLMNMSVVAALAYAICVCALLRQKQWRRQPTPDEEKEE